MIEPIATSAAAAPDNNALTANAAAGTIAM